MLEHCVAEGEGLFVRRSDLDASRHDRESASCQDLGVQNVATIGVYGFTVQTFLDRLREADVGQLLDVRQRRGVRGSDYAWANSARLQAALAEADIEYRHHKELAPTTELRQLQYREDERRGVGKRSRTQLAHEYRERYVAEILERANLDARSD